MSAAATPPPLDAATTPPPIPEAGEEEIPLPIEHDFTDACDAAADADTPVRFHLLPPQVLGDIHRALCFASRYGCLANAVETNASRPPFPLHMANEWSLGGVSGRVARITEWCKNGGRHKYPVSGVFIAGGTIDRIVNPFGSLGTTLTTLEISNVEGLTELPDDFLHGRDRRVLGHVTLVGLPHLTTIGGGFLAHNPMLRRVDVGRMPNLRRIGNDFLAECPRLHKVRVDDAASDEARRTGRALRTVAAAFALLPSLAHIGHRFMFECRRLREFDFAALNSVKFIGNDFFSSCDAYDCEVQMSGWTELQQVGNGFLAFCPQIPVVRFPPVHAHNTAVSGGFTNLVSIGTEFLHCCTALRRVDADALSVVPVALKGGAFEGCMAVGDFTLQSTNVTQIGNSVLQDAAGLQRVTLRRLPRLTCIGACFASNTPALTAVDMDDLPQLKDIRDNLFGHSGVTSFAIPLPASGATTVPVSRFDDRAFANCRQLAQPSSRRLAATSSPTACR